MMDPYIVTFLLTKLEIQQLLNVTIFFYNILVEFRLVVEIVQKQDSNDLP